MKRISMFSRSVVIAVIVLLVAAIPAFAGSTTKTLSTNYTVVNLSTTADALVSALYYKDDGSTWTADADKTNFSVPMNYGMTTIAQYGDSTLTSGKGSVVLSSSEPLAAIVQIQARSPQVSTMGAYIGYTSGSNVFYIPQIQKGLTTASGTGNTQIMIQNIMTEQITATVNLKAYPGSGLSDYSIPSFTIAKYSTKYYDLADDATVPIPWYGSGVVTAQSGKQIAVVVNIFQGANGLQTLNAFPQEVAGTGWDVPQFSSRLSNGFSTPIIIQNVSGGNIAAHAITVACKPTTGFSGSFSVDNPNIVPNYGSFVVNPVTNSPATPNVWSGSCAVTASANVVVFVQTRKPGISDDTSAYEAFRSSGTDTKVIFPLMSKLQNNGFCTAAIIKNLDPLNAATVHVKFAKNASSVGSDYEFDTTIVAGGNLIFNLAIGAEPYNGSSVSVGMPSLWYGSLIVTSTGTTPRPIVGYAQLKNWKGLAGDTFMAHDAFTQP